MLFIKKRQKSPHGLVYDRGGAVLSLLFYLLLQISEFLGIKKLNKRDAEPVT